MSPKVGCNLVVVFGDQRRATSESSRARKSVVGKFTRQGTWIGTHDGRFMGTVLSFILFSIFFSIFFSIIPVMLDRPSLVCTPPKQFLDPELKLFEGSQLNPNGSSVRIRIRNSNSIIRISISISI